MGSSTASETTINTSTDSSNTIVTTMTATDGDNTEDSLDMNDPPPDYLNSENVLEHKHYQQNPILQPVPITPKTPLTAKQKTPPTAKEVEPKFVFEIQHSPKTRGRTKEEKFIYNVAQNENNCAQDVKSVDRLMDEQIEALKSEARRRNSYKAAQNDFDKIEVS